jgi:hypothetical protein
MQGHMHPSRQQAAMAQTLWKRATRTVKEMAAAISSNKLSSTHAMIVYVCSKHSADTAARRAYVLLSCSAGPTVTCIQTAQPAAASPVLRHAMQASCTGQLAHSSSTTGNKQPLQQWLFPAVSQRATRKSPVGPANNSTGATFRVRSKRIFGYCRGVNQLPPSCQSQNLTCPAAAAAAKAPWGCKGVFATVETCKHCRAEVARVRWGRNSSRVVNSGQRPQCGNASTCLAVYSKLHT